MLINISGKFFSESILEFSSFPKWWVFFQTPADHSQLAWQHPLSISLHNYFQLSSEKLPPKLKHFDMACESFIPILKKFSPSPVSYHFRWHWPTLPGNLARHRYTCCISLGLCCYVLFIPKRVLSRGERVAIIRIKFSFASKRSNQACGPQYHWLCVWILLDLPLAAVNMAHRSKPMTALFHLDPNMGPILLCGAL